MSDYLSPEQCVVGNVYAIASRNLIFGVYEGGESGGFVGIREKMGSIYLFTEYHWDLGGSLGTVKPFTDLGPCPIEDIGDRLGLQCSHGRWIHREQGNEHYRTTFLGTIVRFTDYHTDDGSKVEDLLDAPKEDREEDGDHVHWVSNQPLFDWLEKYEEDHDYDAIRDKYQPGYAANMAEFRARKNY